MASEKADVYKVILEGVLLGQKVMNVFHYASTVPGTGAAPLLLQLFRDDVVPSIVTPLSDKVVFQKITVQNLVDFGNAAVDVISSTGLRTGDISGPFDAWGFRLIPETMFFKQGAKRFAGVAEGDISDGYPTTFQDIRLTTLAAKLLKTLPSSFHAYKPAIAATINVLGTPIEFFPDIIAASFSWYTTQNTRKRGRGN